MLHHPDYPVITIPVIGKILDGITIVPQHLIIRSSKDSPISRQLKIKISNGAEHFEIKKVEISDPWIKIEDKTQINLNEINLSLSVCMDSIDIEKTNNYIESDISIYFEQPYKAKKVIKVLIMP